MRCNFLYNNIGSTMMLTDENGNVNEEYSYGPYGELLSGDASKTAYLYNGQYGVATDANGLYYMRTRYYNVSIKRFINQDVVTGTIDNSKTGYEVRRGCRFNQSWFKDSSLQELLSKQKMEKRISKM